MLVVGWSYTSICNLRCAHCYNASGKAKPDELSYKQTLKITKRLIEHKVNAVNFGGGECPLKPGFFKVCKILKDAGIKLSLTTNGTTYKTVLPNLHLFDDIGVSIDFANESKHDKFRGIPGSYKKAIKAIKEFVKVGADVEIVTCVSKLNSSEKELKKLYNLSKKLGVHYWRINRYRPAGRGKTNDSLKLTPNDLKRVYTFFANISKSNIIPDPLFNILGKNGTECPCGKTSLRIQPNGEVSPSVFLGLSGGNILNNPLSTILNSEIFKQVRNRDLTGTKCEFCIFKSKCKGGCAEAAYLEYGNFNMPDPLCWYNEDWNVHEKYLCTAYIPITEKK